jgi:hypothetical protein
LIPLHGLEKQSTNSLVQELSQLALLALVKFLSLVAAVVGPVVAAVVVDTIITPAFFFLLVQTQLQLVVVEPLV